MAFHVDVHRKEERARPDETTPIEAEGHPLRDAVRHNETLWHVMQIPKLHVDERWAAMERVVAEVDYKRGP